MLGQIMSEESMKKLIGGDGIIKEGRNEFIPLEKLSPCGFNTFSVEDIETLVREIKIAGLITPLSVIGPDENGVYKILSGERRYNALKRIHDEDNSEYETVNCYVCGTYDMNQTAQKLIMEVANVSVRKVDEIPHRFEIVKLLKELTESGYMNKWNIGSNLAEYLGVTPNYARFYKRVVYSDNPEIQEMVEKKLIDIKLAAILTNFPLEEQTRFINRIRNGENAWKLYKKEYQVPLDKKESEEKPEDSEKVAETTPVCEKRDEDIRTKTDEVSADSEKPMRVEIPQKEAGKRENTQKVPDQAPKNHEKKVIPTFDSTVFSTEKMKDIFNDYTGADFEEAIHVETSKNGALSGEKQRDVIDYFRMKKWLRVLLEKEDVCLEDEEVVELCREIAEKFEF